MKPEAPLTATQLDLYQSYAAHDPDKLTHSERRLVATIDALRTQLEQAQGDLGDVRAKNRELATRETALREAANGMHAFLESESLCGCEPERELPLGMTVPVLCDWARALSGEQGEAR